MLEYVTYSYTFVCSQDINDDRTVQGGSVVSYNVSSRSLLTHAPTSDSVLNSTKTWNNKTLSIVAYNDIAVYVIGSSGSSGVAASYTVYPTDAFSTHYVVASYRPYSGYP